MMAAPHRLRRENAEEHRIARPKGQPYRYGDGEQAWVGAAAERCQCAFGSVEVRAPLNPALPIAPPERVAVLDPNNRT